MKVAFFDAKPYDKVAFDKFCGENDIKIKYFETKLNDDRTEILDWLQSEVKGSE